MRKFALIGAILAFTLNPTGFNLGQVAQPAKVLADTTPITVPVTLTTASPTALTYNVTQPDFGAEQRAHVEKLSVDVAAHLQAAGISPACAKQYVSAQLRTGIPWQLVAAVHNIETGRCYSTTVASSAGAQGPMQFIPSTWSRYAMDANGDGMADINNIDDAILTGANYLRAGGADHGDYHSALFCYNHAEWYVAQVMSTAHRLGLQ